VAYLLEARIGKPAETAAARESANTPVARQWLSSRHVMAVTDTHATTEELLEAVFSVRAVTMLYKEDQLLLHRVSAGSQLGEMRSW
jgi:hypothetical protein